MKYLLVLLIAFSIISCDNEIESDNQLIGNWGMTEHLWKVKYVGLDSTYYKYNYKYSTPEQIISINITSESEGLYIYGVKGIIIPFTYSIKKGIFAMTEKYAYGDLPYHITFCDTMKIIELNDYILKCINPMDTSMKMVFVNELID